METPQVTNILYLKLVLPDPEDAKKAISAQLAVDVHEMEFSKIGAPEYLHAAYKSMKQSINNHSTNGQN